MIKSIKKSSLRSKLFIKELHRPEKTVRWHNDSDNGGDKQSNGKAAAETPRAYL